MKCPNCGANLTIDDEICSFCGVENPFAEKHREEMRHFTSDFNRTKSQVLEKTQSHSRFVAKITLIAVMIVLNLVVWLMAADGYEVEKFFRNRRISAEYQVHKAELDRLEEERNFTGFYVYYYENHLYYSDLFKEYRTAYNIANNYEIIYNYMMELVTENFEDSYYSAEERIEMMVRQMEYLYDYSKPKEYSDMTQYAQKHQEFIDAAVEQTEGSFADVYEYSGRKISEFRELSTARRQIMVEEGWGIHE